MAGRQCAHCGERFESSGKHLAHLRKCPGRAGAVTFAQPQGQEPNQEQPAEEAARPGAVVIPISACPSEVGLLTRGAAVGLRVVGRLTSEGVVVDNVDLLR